LSFQSEFRLRSPRIWKTSILDHHPSICIECNVAKSRDTARRKLHFTYSALGYTANSSSPQERVVIEKADQEEEATATAANRPAAPAVEHKQQETTETSTSIGLSSAAIATMKKCDVDIDVHDAPNAAVATPPTADHPLERPTNLSLAKQEVNLVDALNIPSPASPISKQVGLKSHSISLLYYNTMYNRILIIRRTRYSQHKCSLLFTDSTVNSVQRWGDNRRSTFPSESTNERGTPEGETTAASDGRQRRRQSSAGAAQEIKFYSQNQEGVAHETLRFPRYWGGKRENPPFLFVSVTLKVITFN